MKIIATCRTRNEEKNVGRFCKAYQGVADEILIADGGSTDKTIEIALSYPDVTVLHFEEEMVVEGGHTINPQGKHVNFLIERATLRGADWIVFDDCDCVPNHLLQKDLRTKLEKADEHPALFVRRVYFWGKDLIFPRMHEPNTGLYAFRPDCGIRADESDPWHLTMRYKGNLYLTPVRLDSLHLDFPYCLLHYTWQTEEATDEKIKFYRDSGVQPTALHPKDFAGPMEPPAWFMSEEPPDAERV